MRPFEIVLLVLGIVIALNIFMILLLSTVLYVIVLVRTNKKKWSRENVEIIDDTQQFIYDEGDRWFERYGSLREDVSIVSDGFRLAGEYYDLGFDTAVIIVPGRMETVRYTHYYAEPWRKAGVNILLIDNRSHGHSEGTFNALGFKEYRDILKWAEFLHEERGNLKVVLYGLCIGSQTCLFAATAKNCPDYVTALAVDGLFGRFGDSFKIHIEERKHKTFPVYQLTMLIEHIMTGARPMTDGPFRRIKEMKKPILFLHSRKDQYSLAPITEQMYEDCPSEKKEIVWFDEGQHSRIRLKNQERYDAVIADWTARIVAPAKKMLEK